MRPAPVSGICRHTSRVRSFLFGSVLVASVIALVCPAHASRNADKQDHHTTVEPKAAPSAHAAAQPDHAAQSKHAVPGRAVFIRRPADNALVGRLNSDSKLGKNSKARLYASRRGSSGLQCVPFARAASGIELKGNAVNWWDAASGVYQRGARPEVGAVLNFRANGSMRLGHVAVVREVVNSREIEIDHANWAWAGKGNISRGVPVIDVSERNDWSAVRVALGHSDEFGSVYGTYGFIYDRPDNGGMVANLPPRGRGAPNRDVGGFDEIAESPFHGSASSQDAPARSLQ